MDRIMHDGRAMRIGVVVFYSFAACAPAASSADIDATGDGKFDGSTADAALPDAPALSIWQPPPGTSWQWQLSGTLDTSFDVAMYDIDLFDTTQAQIDQLHADGRVVICYFSAGSHEDWRPDAAQFPPAAIGAPLDGWPGERWLDTRSAAVRNIMRARLDLAVAQRCDGVEPDNVDAFENSSGFPLTAATQLDFNRFLANEAHARGLSIGLKNDTDQVGELLPYFDWALNEQCFEYDECDKLLPFISDNKAVFHVEYGGQTLASSVCPQANALNFDSLIKPDIDSVGAARIACR